jgi:dienelactone hydrolase
MILTDDINYSGAGINFRGYLAYDTGWNQPSPCVMIAHDWGGRGEFACQKARQLASMGYVGFAIDMYGDARLGHTNEQRRALMTPLKENRERLATHILAAFNKATTLPQVNAKKIAAIGYCFGGMCVLDLARTGAPIKGVVSFHGLLSEPNHPLSNDISAKILVLHGYDDPLVPPLEVTRFANEMTLKKVDWQVHIYGQTAHSFTNPDAHDIKLGLHYNQTADTRSWSSATTFLNEAFIN